MTVESVFNIPEAISFEQAIAVTQALLEQMAQEELSASEIELVLRALVSTENGARGFFVTYLSDDRPWADPPNSAVIAALKTAPAIVSPLLVKNLAMSTAMAITHRRNQHEELAQGSDQVRWRSAQLIQHLQCPELQVQAQALRHSIQTGTGDYQAFLERWSYDTEQQQAMQTALEQIGLG
ncbi:hypothetical protein [Pantanalinema sp. GBBB05]|uniref:hypothetical protein n=1 Tax=Pantanalinema sp. GBBB05 TaxID=2604139 RepID=UPI001DED29F6|nr:hypothetical protein [Pantanalinema sp. GBBB05]